MLHDFFEFESLGHDHALYKVWSHSDDKAPMYVGVPNIFLNKTCVRKNVLS